MNEHVEKMKTEHKELVEKIKNLNKFIHGNEVFKTLNDLEQTRMIKQSGFMESYASALSDRIWVAGGKIN
jgi:hypothetical protein